MDAEVGQTLHPLIRTLLERGPRFSFFQAVRTLQELNPEAVPVGHQGPASRECVRFTSALDLGFPASDVAGIELEAAEGEAGARYRLTTTFLGIYGADSPIPASYTEGLIHQEDPTLERGFLDLFHHRLISLFHRVWEKYRYEVSFRADAGDPFSLRLASLLHVSRTGFPESHHLHPVGLMAFAGVLSQEPRSAASMEVVLGAILPDVPFAIEPFVGRWLPIPEDQQTRLGDEACTLGDEAVLGRRAFDRSATFGLTLRPQSLNDYLAFLPGRTRIESLREGLDLMNSGALDCAIDLEIRSEDVPELELANEDCLLGWTTWLGDPPPEARSVRFVYEGALHG